MDTIEYKNGRGIKYCERCLEQGKLREIARFPGDSPGRFYAIKYCGDCRGEVEKKRKAEFARFYRAKKKRERRLLSKEVEVSRERIEKLEEENWLTKQSNALLRREVTRLGGKV